MIDRDEQQKIMAIIGRIMDAGFGKKKTVVETYRAILRHSGVWCYAREGLWNTWQAEVTQVTGKKSDEDIGAVFSILIGLNPQDHTFVESVLQDINKRGPEIALARVLETVFQVHTQTGEEHQGAISKLVYS